MLANYSELQAEIADTLHRDDLASKIPTFIKLFEHRANRHLRTLLQEITTTLTLTSGTNSVALPADFTEALGLAYEDADKQFNNYLVMVPGAEYDKIWITTAYPTYYTINNSNIYFDANAAENLDVNLRYIKSWDLATTLTNWLLDNYPDVYLYGSLAASAAFIGEDERLGLWSQLASSGIDEANMIANRTRNNSRLVCDAGLIDSGRFNVLTGEFS